MVLAEKSITFLASKRKIEFLRKVENHKTDETGIPAVKLLTREKVCSYKLKRLLINNSINKYCLISER